MKKEKNFNKINKKRLKNFQKYKTTPYGYYSYLIEKKINIYNELNSLKFFIDSSGKLKPKFVTGLSKNFQKGIVKMIKNCRSSGLIPLLSLKK